jgi:hypothetical protein
MTDTTTKTADALVELRRLIANDSYAIAFQTFGQYRTALLKAIDAFAAQPQAEPVAAQLDVTDAKIKALWYEYMGHPHRYSDAGVAFARAVLAAARPPVAQQGAAEAVKSLVATVEETAISYSRAHAEWVRSEATATERAHAWDVFQDAVSRLAARPTQPVAQGLTVEQRDAIAWARDEAENEDYFGRKLNAKRLDLLASLGEQVAALSTTHPEGGATSVPSRAE